MITSHYNNLGINSFAISAVAREATTLTHAEAALILPIIAHRETLQKLSRSNVAIRSADQYFIENIASFYNFNDRYLSYLPETLNAIQFLNDIEIISLDNKRIDIKTPIQFNTSMGKRAEKIQKAAPNIAKMISGNANYIYLNARIAL